MYKFYEKGYLVLRNYLINELLRVDIKKYLVVYLCTR